MKLNHLLALQSVVLLLSGVGYILSPAALVTPYVPDAITFVKRETA